MSIFKPRTCVLFITISPCVKFALDMMSRAKLAGKPSRYSAVWTHAERDFDFPRFKEASRKAPLCSLNSYNHVMFPCPGTPEGLPAYISDHPRNNPVHTAT